MFKERDHRDRYYHIPLEVKYINEKKGYGVFATEYIPDKKVVEVCPIIMYHKDVHSYTRELSRGIITRSHHVHIIESYAFDFDYKRGMVALAMGYGGMYNHSFNPNLIVIKQQKPIPGIVFISLRDINPGEELTHAYSRWEDGLPFDPEPEEGAVVDPVSGVLRSKNCYQLNSFDDFYLKRRDRSVNFVDIAAEDRIRQEEIELKKKEKGPTMGAWIKDRTKDT